MFAVSPGDGPGSLPRLGGQRAASAAEIGVTTTEDFYEIVFVTLAEDSSQVEAELQALGLDVTVDFVPAPPSLEGHLVASEASEGADEVWEFTEPEDFSGPAALHGPTGFTGALRLDVGRPAEDGEPFVSSAISALHPGEALHCTDVEGMTVAEATSVIAAAGVKGRVLERRRRDRIRDPCPHAVLPWRGFRALRRRADTGWSRSCSCS